MRSTEYTDLVHDLLNHTSITHVYLLEDYQGNKLNTTDKAFQQHVKHAFTKNNVNWLYDNMDMLKYNIYLHDEHRNFNYEGLYKYNPPVNGCTPYFSNAIYMIEKMDGWIDQYFYDKYRRLEIESEYIRRPYLKTDGYTTEEDIKHMDLVCDKAKIREPLVKYARRK